MGSLSTIIWGVLFGSIGMGYIIYGRKQKKGIALLSGIVLSIFPYFFSNLFVIIFIGIVLMLLPYFIRY
ncbi:MAG: hypothetical protein ACE5D6_06330 [Candidatus Zixiibacteriota bacterium]